MENSKPNSLVPIQNQGIAKVENSLQITHKIIFNGTEKLFNKAFIRLNSKADLDKTQNYCFLLKYNLIKIEDFHYEAKVPEDYFIAVELLSKIIEIDRKSECNYLLRSIAYFYLDEYMSAIEDSNSAISINPNSRNAYYLRGLSKAENSYDYKGAISDYKKAFLYELKSPNAFLKCGDAYSKLKDYNKAIEYFSKAIDLNSKFADAFYERGNVKNNLKDYQGAIEDYSKAIEINPKDADAYFFRGNVKDDLKDYQGAIEDYTKAIEINPEDADVYFNRNLAKKKLNDLQGAEEDLKKYNELIQNNDTN